MNRALAAAVVDAFRRRADGDARSALRRRSTSETGRVRSNWLHTSGLALYFLSRARELGIDGCDAAAYSPRA